MVGAGVGVGVLVCPVGRGGVVGGGVGGGRVRGGWGRGGGGGGGGCGVGGWVLFGGGRVGWGPTQKKNLNPNQKNTQQTQKNKHHNNNPQKKNTTKKKIQIPIDGRHTAVISLALYDNRSRTCDPHFLNHIL